MAEKYMILLKNEYHSHEFFLGNFSISPGEIKGFMEWGSGVSWRHSLKRDLLLIFAVADIWGFLLMNPY
jgi:hypothetical protein